MIPPIVLMSTGQTLAKIITASSVESEKLKISSATGRNAMPGKGRSNSRLASR